MKSGDEKIKVLFICSHNSGRSQIAEAYLKEIGGDRFDVESAGYDLRKIDPIVVEVMKEEGIDLNDKGNKDAWNLYREGRMFNYVITVCDRTTEKDCPLFPKPFNQLHWPFPDPSSFEGTREEKLEKTRTLRDELKRKIEEFIKHI